MKKAGPNANKKVLLHDRMRHTVHRVASTHSAILSKEGYLSPGWGIPQSCPSHKGTPSPDWGIPLSYSSWGYPCPGTSPPGVGISRFTRTGVPPARTRVPPSTETTWDHAPRKEPRTGISPPRVGRQADASENITFPSYYARGL